MARGLCARRAEDLESSQRLLPRVPFLSWGGRIALDGSPTDEVVDDEARAMAREQLELRKRRREAERQATAPPEKPAEALPPPPPPPPQETPRKRAGFEALRQAHRNRIAGG